MSILGGAYQLGLKISKASYKGMSEAEKLDLVLQRKLPNALCGRTQKMIGNILIIWMIC